MDSVYLSIPPVPYPSHLFSIPAPLLFFPWSLASCILRGLPRLEGWGGCRTCVCMSLSTWAQNGLHAQVTHGNCAPAWTRCFTWGTQRPPFSSPSIPLSLPQGSGVTTALHGQLGAPYQSLYHLSPSPQAPCPALRFGEPSKCPINMLIKLLRS